MRARWLEIQLSFEHRMMLFPPNPRGMRGRESDLEVLARTIEHTQPTRVALVGSGGSGKSMLAAALGHRLARVLEPHWLRVGAWDFSTLVEILALRFGASRERGKSVRELRKILSERARLVVLDNHEDDVAMGRFLDAFEGTRASFVITARRCLLSGVLVFPVTAPLVTSGKSAFPKVAKLTRLLRWNPLALDIANAIVTARSSSVAALEKYLVEHGVDRVHPIDHEDDLPEVALLVRWAWERLSNESKRVLAVLSHVEGDHVGIDSLVTLARAKRSSLRVLERWHLVQEAVDERFTVHAVVRHAVKKRTKPNARAYFEHWVGMLERHPERLTIEQTHLFAAMDHAHRTSSMHDMLRVERLLARLDS